ncbi:MAG: hypothetical protein NDJ89_13545 [Oligoflexia bacterium]|nr:hypothetical protein [Oligoflexia bacterium]
MQIDALRVLNISKTKVKAANDAEFASFEIESFLPGEFRMDSCQRVLWLCSEEALRSKLCGKVIPRFVEIYSGAAAYQFMLRVATGLESQVIGETDIFGQVKEAWKKFEASNTATGLKGWMQRIFEDTKEIRSAHLHNQGGATYGSLVRMLIREHVEKTGKALEGPVVLIGAGALAASVGPYLLDHEVLLTNRSREKLETLHLELSRSPGSRVSVVSSGADEERALQEASVVVVCIPYDPSGDSGRVSQIRPDAVAIHLGGMRHQAGAWAEHARLHCLDDIFELQKSQGEVRSLRCAHALKACADRAKLRTLGSSLTIPHGWEDLAVFA